MGTNGLTPLETLRANEKCPERPTKRKFKTRALADTAAIEASRDAKMTIVAYACPGCGYFHLTRKVGGSDIVHDSADPIVTPGMRTRLVVVDNPPPERNWEVFPRIAGNPAAREKLFAEFLADNPGPLAIADVRTALSCGVDTARGLLRSAGFTAKRGPGAKWEPPVDKPVESVENDSAVDWITPTSFPAHITIDDYVKAMAGVGLVVRIQVRHG